MTQKMKIYKILFHPSFCSYSYPKSQTSRAIYHLRHKHKIILTDGLPRKRKRRIVNLSTSDDEDSQSFTAREENDYYDEDYTNYRRDSKSTDSSRIKNSENHCSKRIKQSSENLGDFDLPSSRIKEEIEDNRNINQVWMKEMPKNDLLNESSSSSERLMPIAKAGNSKEKLNRIDLALSKMLIASSIPFEVIDTKHFFNFIQELNPKYRLPRSHDLKEKVLDGLTKL